MVMRPSEVRMNARGRKAHDDQVRKVADASVKMFGETWKHPALKAYNGKEVTVKARLNEAHQTELTAMDGDAVICVMGRGEALTDRSVVKSCFTTGAADQVLALAF